MQTDPALWKIHNVLWLVRPVLGQGESHFTRIVLGVITYRSYWNWTSVRRAGGRGDISLQLPFSPLSPAQIAEFALHTVSLRVPRVGHPYRVLRIRVSPFAVFCSPMTILF